MAEKLKKLVIGFENCSDFVLEPNESSLCHLKVDSDCIFLNNSSQYNILSNIIKIFQGENVDNLFFATVSSVVAEFSRHKLILSLQNNRIDCEVVKSYDGTTVFFSGFNCCSNTMRSNYLRGQGYDDYYDTTRGSLIRQCPSNKASTAILIQDIVEKDSGFFDGFSKLVKDCGFVDVDRVVYPIDINKRVPLISYECIQCRTPVGYPLSMEQMGSGLNDLLSLYTYYKHCEMFGGILLTPDLGNFHPILYRAVEDALKKQDKVQVFVHERP